MNDKLTVEDYINRPMIELAVHPDFDLETFEAIARILETNANVIKESFVALVTNLLNNRKEN